MTPQQIALAEQVTKFYLESGDFNGLGTHGLDPAGIDTADVIALIQLREVDLVRGDLHPNPAIKAFDAEPPGEQIAKIANEGLVGCLYPTPEALNRRQIETSGLGPYTKSLTLGAPQLSYRCFDLRALEWFWNDPRFEVRSDDIHGTIIQRAGTDVAGQHALDGIDFFEFGFAYNAKLERVVAAFMRYLHDLPTPQQIELSRFELEGDYHLHPDFYRTQIIGDFPERPSIYDAFLEEKNHINAICRLIGKPSLFRTEFHEGDRPHGFGIILRPTLKEYRDFALMLDQLLSDDMDKKFFAGEVTTERQLTDEEGNVENHSIGTIKLLETWLNRFFKPSEREPIEEMFTDFRAVRQERMKPAHKIEENIFDQKYVGIQRELIKKGYNAVHTLRMVLENHPRARGYDVPEHIRAAKVWSF